MLWSAFLIQAADTPAVLRNRMINSFFLSDRLPGFSAAIGDFILSNCIKPIGIFCIFIRLRVELLFQLPSTPVPLHPNPLQTHTPNIPTLSARYERSANPSAVLS